MPDKTATVLADPRPPSDPGTRPGRTRVIVLVAVVLACLAAGIGYAVHAGLRATADPRNAGGHTSAVRLDPKTLLGVPRIVFRSTAADASYGQVSMVALSDPAGPRAVTSLTCDRVDVARTTGLCVSAHRGIITTYTAYLFNSALKKIHSFTVSGPPSRARLSPDARYAAVTVFVTGHAYSGPAFSTATTLYDVRRGVGLGNLESFTIYRDGVRIHPEDINFWGVTFARDDDTFYATLATDGVTYLVRGSLRTRTVRTLTTNVECPSLSPDGTRIAFKQRMDPGDKAATWWVTVLNLRTMKRTELADSRSVDDQIAWFDNRTVAYGLPRSGAQAAVTDTWVEPADGTGRARILVPQAWSPAIVR